MRMIRFIVIFLITTFFIVASPALAQPVSECKNIPPVHHRMFGISGPSRQGDGVENTITGIQATYDDGGRWFETDIQQLENRKGEWGQGTFVLFHDATLDRTTPDTGPIRERRYSELPLTNAGLQIPKLSHAFKWLRDHPRTHLLIEIKMRLQWTKIVALLKRYDFDHTNRVMFDIGGADAPGGRKHDVAVAMHDKLGPYAVTGVKRWDSANRPATWIRNFGTMARLDLQQGIDNKTKLIKAGVKWRFSKILNGNSKLSPAQMWRRAVESGAFTQILTERTAQYREWCKRVS